jgi:hypothetical protein
LFSFRFLFVFFSWSRSPGKKRKKKKEKRKKKKENKKKENKKKENKKKEKMNRFHWAHWNLAICPEIFFLEHKLNGPNWPYLRAPLTLR